jgi:hypothetical protein
VEEDKMHKPIITDEREKELYKVADATMAKFIRELPTILRAKALGAIAVMFGFENQHYTGQWRVDHCNSRTSEISNLISSKAKIIFKNECDLVITEKVIKSLIKKARPKSIWGTLRCRSWSPKLVKSQRQRWLETSQKPKLAFSQSRSRMT